MVSTTRCSPLGRFLYNAAPGACVIFFTLCFHVPRKLSAESIDPSYCSRTSYVVP